MAPIDRDRGLVLVYGAAIAGWASLVAWGALRALDVGRPREIGAAIGVAVGLFLLAELVRLHTSPGGRDPAVAPESAATTAS